MALANTAWVMATHGKSVLVIDWDLEAPGLHLYYRQFLADPDLGNTDGILDMFHGFVTAAGPRDADEAPEDLRALHAEHAAFERYSVSVDHPFPQGGKLHFIGPGRLDDEYVRRLHSINWSGFLNSEDGQEYLAVLRGRMQESDYDYILIDSRTGYSDGADICTLALPDSVVVGVAMNSQAIEGAAHIAQRLARHDRAIRLHLAPMHIELSEKTRLDERMAYARRVLDRYLPMDDEDELASYWGEVQVPYRPYYAFGEELAAIVEDPRHRASVIAQYVQLAARITDSAINDMQPATAAQRLSYVEAYRAARRPETAEQTVSMLYDTGDQLWADWIAQQLRDAGVTVTSCKPEHWEEEAGKSADPLLVLLSPHLLSSAAGHVVEQITADADAGRAPERQPVGIRVSGARLPQQFDWPGVPDLSVLDEDRARRAVLARFRFFTGDVPLSPPAGGHLFPGRQPAVWQVAPRNADFVGREAALTGLWEQFAAQPGPQVLWGLAGVGKTQIALEYAHRFASQYDMVWWVPATDADNIRATLVRLDHKVSTASGSTPRKDWEALVDELRQGKHFQRWLLVFDDADSYESIAPFLPGGNHGHVLIASRNPDWAGLTTRQVEVFTPQESLALLSRKLPGAGDSELDALAQRLGHLPIWETATTAWLVNTGESVAEFIDQLDASGPRVVAERQSPRFEEAAEACVLAYERLREQAPAAARLLELCSCMSSDGVGLRIVQSPAMTALLGTVDAAVQDSMRVPGLVNQLRVQTLAVVDPHTHLLKVHRLVQSLVLDHMSEEERRATRSDALKVLAAQVPDALRRDAREFRDVFAELDKHVTASGALDSDDPGVHDWLISQVRYRWFNGQWEAGRELGTRVLDRWRTRLGEDHSSVLKLEAQVGAACRMLGRYREALTHSQHSWRVQRDRAPRDPYTLFAARGYAADLRAHGKFIEAYEEDRATYSGLCAEIGEDQVETLNASSNLALSRYYCESAESAARQDLSTFELRRRVLTDDHHLTWKSCARVGADYREAWQLDLSEQYLAQARDGLVSLQGPTDPLTLQTVQNLGMTLLRQGRTTDALAMIQSTHLCFQQWQDDHPLTIFCRMAMAAAHYAAGAPDAAVGYAKQALAQLVEVFDAGHPFTGICSTNLALYLLADGDAEQAATHARKAVKLLRESFGRDHRYTLVAEMNRNNCLAELGEISGGELADEDKDLYSRCSTPTAWGPRHPVTLTALANHASSSRNDGDALRESLRIHSIAHIGEAHPLTLACTAEPYHRLGLDLEVQDV
ncbi:tetratricopeptide repeat protein [Streptomyces sp. PRB2-1]|uniref:Tetratricopeptide repeat protein n=2 Tax=Actinacidiphila epipremni TaxID=2053013 RepID=A0ABX0ZVD9_9ACTN|nr:FxSxx-COOH system tetratricopeptide repeat protein [Actinacidiphila epipremni]NJP47166.1 tetratricopeptide repeat protein [Actinacidiphila epipremni]